MPKLTVGGHPLHPILSDGWVLFPFSLTMDLLALSTHRRGYADAANYALVGGIAAGLAAAAAGVADYLTIPSETETKRTANTHALLNATAMSLYAVNLALRLGSDRPRLLPVALSAVGVAVLGVSASYGGDLVYKHGMRVHGASPVEAAPEARPPGDEAVEGALEAAKRLVPSGGPELDAVPQSARPSDLSGGVPEGEELPEERRG